MVKTVQSAVMCIFISLLSENNWYYTTGKCHLHQWSYQLKDSVTVIFDIFCQHSIKTAESSNVRKTGLVWASCLHRKSHKIQKAILA